mmetsp:Transcript_15927/g.41160  ORF Transcript_15927/g.41160 Transcript_15927/m.41160 type:complete len:266 (-) Transcript_15927:343-1140(-)
MGTQSALATAPSLLTISPVVRPLATYMPRSTRTRQLSKPVSSADVGSPCSTRSAKKLMHRAPMPIQHCWIRNGTPASHLSSFSCTTAPKEVSATAAVRCPKPRNHWPSGHEPLLNQLPPLAMAPRATCSERQKAIVDATTRTTSVYWSLVCFFPSTTRVSPTVIAMANALPTKLKVPTSRCSMDMKLSMSPHVNMLVVSMKRHNMSGLLSLRIVSFPLATAQPAPMPTAVAHAWKVSAGIMNGKVPPLDRFTQSIRIGPEALSST